MIGFAGIVGNLLPNLRDQLILFFFYLLLDLFGGQRGPTPVVRNVGRAASYFSVAAPAIVIVSEEGLASVSRREQLSVNCSTRRVAFRERLPVESRRFLLEKFLLLRREGRVVLV